MIITHFNYVNTIFLGAGQQPRVAACLKFCRRYLCPELCYRYLCPKICYRYLCSISVYLISRNGDLLHTMEGVFIRPMAFFTFMASTLIILQIWYFTVLFINRYGNSHAREYIGLFINMYLMYFMADGIRDNWGAYYFRYHGAWALILLSLAIQYVLARRHARTKMRNMAMQAGNAAAAATTQLQLEMMDTNTDPVGLQIISGLLWLALTLAAIRKLVYYFKMARHTLPASSLS